MINRFIAYVLCLIIINPTIAIADVEEIRQRGKLLVGMPKDKQKPFFYNNKNGDLVGIDVDIAHLIAHELGVKLEIIQTKNTWNEVVDDVAMGKTDIAISYISITPERSEKVNFSRPYAVVRPVCILNRKYLAQAEKLGLDSLAKIFNNPNFPFMTQHDTAYTILARNLFKNTEIITGDTVKALENLLSNKVAIYFDDEVDVATVFLDKPEHKLHLVNYPFSEYQDNIGIPVQYNSPKLLSVINAVLETSKIYYKIDDLIPLLHKEFEVH